jgi:hypothetical protein
MKRKRTRPAGRKSEIATTITAAIRSRSAPITGRIISGCPILSPGLFARPAATERRGLQAGRAIPYSPCLAPICMPWRAKHAAHAI